MSRITPNQSPEPTRRTNQWTGDEETPTSWRLKHRLPHSDSTKRLIDVFNEESPHLAADILQCISKFYYIPIIRENFESEFTIHGTIEREARTGKSTKDTFHYIKAAEYYKSIEGSLKRISDYLKDYPDCDYVNEITSFYHYVSALNIKLADELRRIPVNVKEKIKNEPPKLDIDAIPYQALTTEQRNAVDVINVTPIKKEDQGSKIQKSCRERSTTISEARALFKETKVRKKKLQQKKPPKKITITKEDTTEKIIDSLKQLADTHGIEIDDHTSKSPERRNMFSFLAAKKQKTEDETSTSTTSLNFPTLE